MQDAPLDLDVIRRAAERLRAGGVVAFPTETVYGLGADALNPRAVAEVFRLKGRPANNPLIVHVAGPAAARGVAGRWTAEADALAAAFWPGPLSIVVPRGENLPAAVTAGGPGVAVRCPNHPMALALLFEAGCPLVGPSANRSGRVSPTMAQHVEDGFAGEGVTVLDGGPCGTGIESTVVSLMEATPRVLRPGVIGAEAIARVLGRAVADAGRGTRIVAGDDGGRVLASPGLLASHYAPEARAVLYASPEELEELREDHDGRIVVLARGVILPEGDFEIIEMPPAAAEYAAVLYRALREADALEPSLIAIERPPLDDGDPESTPIWRAIADRLGRATA